MPGTAMSVKRRAPGRLTERFRRAICSDDLAAAKRIAEQARRECTEAQPFTIQNQERYGVPDAAAAHVGAMNIVPVDEVHAFTSMDRPGASRTASGSIGFASASTIGGTQKLASLSSGTSDYGAASHIYDSPRQCPGLSASQYRLAQHRRTRDRDREAGRAKSSLVLAVENGASIEMVQWLLDMGHEQGRFSTDARGCTIVSLAAQHDRCDIIEACCTDAVAHAASIHHIHVVGHGQRDFSMTQDEDDEVEDDDNKGNSSKEDDSVDEYTSSQNAGPSTPRASQQPASKLRDVSTRAASESEATKPGFKAWTSAMQDSEDSQVDDLVGTTVQRLLDAPDELGRTALSLASMKGYLDVVRLLLDYGASFDQADGEGNTPLHYAAAYNHLLVVQLLIERGCTFALKNVFDFTAADYAYTTSLKSALEAFARAQYEGKRSARTRAVANEASPSPMRTMADSMRGSSGPVSRGSPAIPHRQDSSSYPTSTSSGPADGIKSLLSSTSLLSLGASRAHSTQPPSAASSSTNVASTSAASLSQPQLLRSPELAKRGSPRFKQPLPW